MNDKPDDNYMQAVNDTIEMIRAMEYRSLDLYHTRAVNQVVVLWFVTSVFTLLYAVIWQIVH